MRLEFQRFPLSPKSPTLGSADRAVPLTNQARAFRQIKHRIDRDKFDLKTSLEEVLKVRWRSAAGAGEQLTVLAADLLSFLTEGFVPDRQRGRTRQISSLVPMFYEPTLDCFFLRFNRALQDDLCPELMIHVVTNWDPGSVLGLWLKSGGPLVPADLVEHLRKDGLLTWSKVLPDNSRAAWEQCTNQQLLVPNFQRMQRLLAGSSERLAE